jgi:hypothetical protein
MLCVLYVNAVTALLGIVGGRVGGNNANTRWRRGGGCVGGGL